MNSAGGKVVSHLKRRLLAKPPRAKYINLQGKHFIVTGASPGSVGFATARTLASWGATVMATARHDTQALRQALQDSAPQSDSQQIHTCPLDLTQAESVVSFCNQYYQLFGSKLDGLINNAGIHADLMASWKQPQKTEEGFEIHWRTNYLGPMHLTLSLLPLLQITGQQYGDARVVFVSSHLHQKGLNSEFFQPQRPYHSWEAYGQSKLALLHAANEIQARFSATDHVQGFALHPGSIASNIAMRGIEGHRWMQSLLRIANPLQSLFLLTPDQGAQTQLHCATAPGIPGARYYERCEEALPSSEVQDSAIAARLWQDTEHWVHTLPKPRFSSASNRKEEIA